MRQMRHEVLVGFIVHSGITYCARLVFNEWILVNIKGTGFNYLCRDTMNHEE